MKKAAILISLLTLSVSLFAQYDSLWTKTFGYTGNDYCNSVIETYDGYFLFAGYTQSMGAGGFDFWLVKTDSLGDTIWTKTYGGANDDMARSILETHDHYYLLMGTTESFGAGGSDGWILKLDTLGDTVWTKTYGDAQNNSTTAAVETEDGLFAVIGNTTFINIDPWIMIIDTLGDTLCTKTYGGSGDDLLSSITKTHDGYLLTAGYSVSYGPGVVAGWIMKTDDVGDTIWTKYCGGSSIDVIMDVIELNNGNYLFGGMTTSFGAGNYDYWVLKTDTLGDTLWTKTYGGSEDERCTSLVEMNNGHYLFNGQTKSFGAGNNDCWVIMTDTLGGVVWEETYGGTGSESNNKIIKTSNGHYLCAGNTKSYGAGSDDGYMVCIDDCSVEEFNGIKYNGKYLSGDVDLTWNTPASIPPMDIYEINVNSLPDSIDAPDTVYALAGLDEGVYEWFVTAYNTYGYNNHSDTDTFYIDNTSPAVMFMEQLSDTDWTGPYEFSILSEDTMAGVDSIVVYYSLPGEASWNTAHAVHDGDVFYTGTIPSPTQTGYIFYYIVSYDRADPSNFSRYPAYPDVYSFRVTGLTGVSDSPAAQEYELSIKQLSNTSINFTLPQQSPVSIQVFDINGRVVLNKSMEMPKGEHTMNLDIVPGVYFVRVNTNYGSAEQKIVQIK